MVIFSIKLLNNLRKAIAGRRFPHQLAGGVALGVLLGIIPHGNLLALIVLVTVLCFQVNHALLGVVAIAVSFVATQLDTYSHRVGEYLLTHPTGHDLASQAWALPVVPWTDLNNTVVLGSFVIGMAAVLPIFAVTLPMFRWIAPADATAKSTSLNSSADADAAKNSPEPSASTDVKMSPTDARQCASLILDPKESLPPPRFASLAAGKTPPATIAMDIKSASENSSAQSKATVATMAVSDKLPTNEQMVSVETRIDVIRIKDFRDQDSPNNPSGAAGTHPQAEQPMDEALNYLLRQLRHSQERKAAG